MRDRVPLLFNDDVALQLVRPAQGRRLLLPQRPGRRGRVRHRGRGRARVAVRRAGLPRRRLRRDPARHPAPLAARQAAAAPARDRERAATCARPSATATSTASSSRWRPTRERDIRRPERLDPRDEDGRRSPCSSRAATRLTEMVLAPPPVRRRGLGRLLLSVGVQHPRLRAARRARAPAAARAPDLRGRRLRRSARSARVPSTSIRTPCRRPTATRT